MSDTTHVIVVIDSDGNEALYVGGDRVPVEGTTVFAVDIADATRGMAITFSHVEISDAFTDDEWPEQFDGLLRYVVAKDAARKP